MRELGIEDAWTAEEQAEHRKAWVEALKSGDYDRGVGALMVPSNGTTTYCCLGVACVVAAKDPELEGLIRVDERHQVVYSTIFGPDGNKWESDDAELPPLLVHYFGLPDSNAYFADDSTMEASSLIGLNDDLGWDFGRIADVIVDEWGI